MQTCLASGTLLMFESGNAIMYLEHGSIEVDPAHEGHYALLLGMRIEHVHDRALAAAHAAMDVHPCSSISTQQLRPV